ncbi:Uncharacterized protein TCM_023866 isoform 2, partial [Theobroma cacao]
KEGTTAHPTISLLPLHFLYITLSSFPFLSSLFSQKFLQSLPNSVIPTQKIKQIMEISIEKEWTDRMREK